MLYIEYMFVYSLVRFFHIWRTEDKMKNTVFYNGRELTVRGGQWADEMNSCFYKVVDNVTVPG